jgi:hypothetical protein
MVELNPEKLYLNTETRNLTPYASLYALCPISHLTSNLTAQAAAKPLNVGQPMGILSLLSLYHLEKDVL